VVFHEFLKVEVGKIVSLGKLEKLGKFGVSMDFAAILRILEFVASDVVIDFLANSNSFCSES
jgi:hypothetical protein